MGEIDTNILDKEQLVQIIAKLQKENKEKLDEFSKKIKDSDETINKMKESLEAYQETMDKVRFPGINKAELPSNEDIAKALGLDIDELNFHLEKKPEKYLLKVEHAASSYISSLKADLKKAEVDISGASIIELMDDQENMFWSKYHGSATIDDKYMENLENSANAFFKMKKQYTIEKDYLAKVSIIQDCRISAYLHYRERIDGAEELLINLPEKQENKEMDLLNEKIAKLEQLVESLNLKNQEETFKESQKVQDEEQNKLATIAEGEIPQEALVDEEPVVEEQPKKKGRK